MKSDKKNMMQDSVLYVNNELILSSFGYNYTIIYVICYILQHYVKGTYTYNLTLRNLESALGRRLNPDQLNKSIRLIQDRSGLCNLFCGALYDGGILSVTINHKLDHLFCRPSKNYTKICFSDILSLSSGYAKRLYLLLVMRLHTGKLKMSLTDLAKILLPQNYEHRTLVTIVKRASREISSKTLITVNLKWHKTPRSYDAVIFIINTHSAIDELDGHNDTSMTETINYLKMHYIDIGHAKEAARNGLTRDEAENLFRVAQSTFVKRYSGESSAEVIKNLNNYYFGILRNDGYIKCSKICQNTDKTTSSDRAFIINTIRDLISAGNYIEQVKFYYGALITQYDISDDELGLLSSY